MPELCGRDGFRPWSRSVKQVETATVSLKKCDRLMARTRTVYLCQSCGGETLKWQGRCPHCGSWNTLTEQRAERTGADARTAVPGRALAFEKLSGPVTRPPRLKTGIGELDRPLGGGLVPGSVVLLGGDPGIGKSTLVLQALAAMARCGGRALYVTGEESPAQIQMRGERLGVSDAPLALLAATDVGDILASWRASEGFDVICVDSIQTLHLAGIEAAPGTVTQLRASADLLIREAKARGAALILIGHVTKDGQLAGPRLLEHMVDVVLYFEGERGHEYRILRAVKNRFGATDEIGVFEMTAGGLTGVANPSRLFLPHAASEAPGTVVFAGMEGSRALLCEIQALVADANPGSPRRAVVGWDAARLAMVLAVLDARAGLGLARYDVYLNVAGGLRIRDPAADLAVAAALVSALTGRRLPGRPVVFGELALTGEIRPVAHRQARLKEAAKLGFDQALIPALGERRRRRAQPEAVQVHLLRHVQDLVRLFTARRSAVPPSSQREGTPTP